MPERTSKKKRDLNELAKSIVDKATSDSKEDAPQTSNKNQAAVELGRLGGLKGGKARAQKLTASERSDIARKAAEARWRKRRAGSD